ncbi:MAG: L,D-transpeptidase family protein [Bacillota bacterium]
MSRFTRRRASRILAIVLILTLIAGIAFGVRKLTKSPESIAAKNPSPSNATQPKDDFQAKGNSMMPLLARAAAEQSPLIKTETPLISTEPPTVLPVTPPATQPATHPAVQLAPEPVVPTPVVVTPAPVALTGNPLADSQARLDGGDPIGARTILNEALLSGHFSEADAPTVKGLLSKINQEAVLGRRTYKNDTLCSLYTVQPGDRLQKLAASNSITWELLCRVNGITDPRKMRAGQTIKIIKGPFHAVITKSKFTMDLYLGSPGEAGATYVMSFPVGLGKDDSTPPGTWIAQNKLKNPTYYSPRGEGVIAAKDPKNPLGAYWIGLSGVEGQAVGKASYGIHGTIDPESIGKQESMGCIRLRNEDVEVVYQLLVEGKSRVVVKD